MITVLRCIFYVAVFFAVWITTSNIAAREYKRGVCDGKAEALREQAYREMKRKDTT